MTEKTRFIYRDSSMWFSFIDRQTGKHLNAIMCCNLMNELHEENEQLRTKNNAYLQDIETFKEENTALKLENEWLKEENQELHRLNHEEVESWSDEKKQMIADFSNLMFGDKINDRKQKNNWKNEY